MLLRFLSYQSEIQGHLRDNKSYFSIPNCNKNWFSLFWVTCHKQMNITRLNLIIAHLVIRAMMRAMMMISRKKNSMNKIPTMEMPVPAKVTPLKALKVMIDVQLSSQDEDVEEVKLCLAKCTI